MWRHENYVKSRDPNYDFYYDPPRRIIKKGENMKPYSITRAEIQLREQQKDAAITEIKEYCAFKAFSKKGEKWEYYDRGSHETKSEIERILTRYEL